MVLLSGLISSKHCLFLLHQLSKYPSEEKWVVESSKTRSAEDRWRALRSFRRAKGLCQFYAEKWSKDHKCSETVQLHLLHELCELFQCDEDQSMDYDGPSTMINYS